MRSVHMQKNLQSLLHSLLHLTMNSESITSSSAAVIRLDVGLERILAVLGWTGVF